MTIQTLDHVNLRTIRLDEMVAWYETILGLTKGARPDFTFDGAWMYAGDNPIVHLVDVKTEQRSIEPKIEHFALGAKGFAKFVALLNRHGVSHTVDPVPGFPIVQINLHDPDGNHIHVDFSTEDAGQA
ncbi:MAG: glyoxalase [Silicimonas sp.]|nr:glyoxalase [Silicimonas sp.]